MGWSSRLFFVSFAGVELIIPKRLPKKVRFSIAYEHTSVIITTNLSSRNGRVFGDAKMAIALLDRTKSSIESLKARTWYALKFKWAPFLAF